MHLGELGGSWAGGAGQGELGKGAGQGELGKGAGQGGWGATLYHTKASEALFCPNEFRKFITIISIYWIVEPYRIKALSNGRPSSLKARGRFRAGAAARDPARAVERRRPARRPAAAPSLGGVKSVNYDINGIISSYNGPALKGLLSEIRIDLKDIHCGESSAGS